MESEILYYIVVSKVSLNDRPWFVQIKTWKCICRFTFRYCVCNLRKVNRKLDWDEKGVWLGMVWKTLFAKIHWVYLKCKMSLKNNCNSNGKALHRSDLKPNNELKYDSCNPLAKIWYSSQCEVQHSKVFRSSNKCNQLRK